MKLRAYSVIALTWAIQKNKFPKDRIELYYKDPDRLLKLLDEYGISTEISVVRDYINSLEGKTNGW